jgi:hypothetical protein
MDRRVKFFRTLYVNVNTIYRVWDSYSLAATVFLCRLNECYILNLSISGIFLFIKSGLALGPMKQPSHWILKGGGGVVSRCKAARTNLTTQVHIIPRLRMCGAIPTLPCTSSCFGAQGQFYCYHYGQISIIQIFCFENYHILLKHKLVNSGQLMYFSSLIFKVQNCTDVLKFSWLRM